MKASDFATPFRVGLLVVFGAIVTLYMMSVVGTDSGGDDRITVYAKFPNASGLAEKSFVTIAGISVGQIEKIALDGSSARVDLSIRRDVILYEGIPTKDGGFKNGASVQAKQASFIGDYYLEVTPGLEGRQLVEGDEIKNVVLGTDIEQLMSRMNDIATDVAQVTKSLADVFGTEEGKESLRTLLHDLTEMVTQVNNFVGENSPKLNQIVTNIESITYDVEDLTSSGKDSIGNILRDTEAIVQEVRYVIGQSSSDLQSGLGSLKGTLSRLQSTLDSLNYSLQNIQDITDKINEGEGTIGELVNNPAIAQKTEAILTDASDYLGRITRLRTIIELRNEYHVNSRQFKNILGLRLQPTPNKYYLIELVDDYRGRTETFTTDVNTTNADDPDGLYRETREVTTDTFKFSLQFAQIYQVNPWFGIGGRFGLIESTGGLGANLIFLEDRSLEIQADLFDFGLDISPRLRTFATYQFFGAAYLAGGVDDIFNDRRTEYFVGIGLRFDDDDLKAILSTTGVPAVP